MLLKVVLWGHVQIAKQKEGAGEEMNTPKKKYIRQPTENTEQTGRQNAWQKKNNVHPAVYARFP